jgi:MFS family permease
VQHYFCSLAPVFNFLLAMAALFAISQVVFHPATYAMVVQRASVSHRAKYISYHQVGGFIGSAVGTMLIATLASMRGWRNTTNYTRCWTFHHLSILEIR